MAASDRRLVSTDGKAGARRHSLAGKLTSTTGLVLVLLCFLLPFVTISCESAVVDYEATYHGTDFVVGGDPDITVTGPNNAVEEREGGHVGPQPLAILTVVAVVLGVVVVWLPYARLAACPTRTRAITTAAAAVLALLLLMANQLAVVDHIVDELQTTGEELAVSRSTAEDMVESRFGFWLALVLLVAVVVANVGEFGWPLLKARLALLQQPAAPPPSGPFPSPGPFPPPGTTPPPPPQQPGPPAP